MEYNLHPLDLVIS